MTVEAQRRNPLHGLTLEAILTALVDHFGWDDLGARILINSFNTDPSIKSSLKFLRKKTFFNSCCRDYGPTLKRWRRSIRPVARKSDAQLRFMEERQIQRYRWQISKHGMPRCWRLAMSASSQAIIST